MRTFIWGVIVFVMKLDGLLEKAPLEFYVLFSMALLFCALQDIRELMRK